MTTAPAINTAAVLAAARRLRTEAETAEAGVLVEAVHWAALHVVTDPDDAATWENTPVPLAGPGAPLIDEYCIAEFATALRVSTDSGRALLAHAIEIAHRLPRIWHRIHTGDLPVWRARRIAEQTLTLSPQAAEYVDQQLAPYAHKTGPVTERLVDHAIASFMPDHARKIAEKAAETRYLTIEHDQVSFAGTSRIHGELDLADALDLDNALIRGAETLKAAGNTQPLDIRRTLALGDLARGQRPLELVSTSSTSSGGAPTSQVVEKVAQRPSRNPRDLTLYLHLNDAGDPVHVEGHRPITLDQLRAWCRHPDTTITVQPVIDLNKPLATAAYRATDTLREHVILRDRVCVFPWCNRTARRADLDHVTPYAHGGPTSTDNLAALCRRHHRLKTHIPWTYTTVEPGVFLWRSPHGYTYLRNNQGTQDLTPRPVDPPGDG